MTPDEYIAFLEVNGICLLEYQKIMLKSFIEQKPIYTIPVRHCGYSIARSLAKIYNMFNEEEVSVNE